MKLNPELRSELEKLIEKCERPACGLLPAFHRIQKELGYIPEDVMEEVAELVGISKVLVYGVLSFYTHFNFKIPAKNVVMVCNSVTCGLLESEEIIGEVEKVLGIKLGETDSNGEFTLYATPCLGGCDKAPVMMVNWKMYDNVKKDQVSSILESLRG